MDKANMEKRENSKNVKFSLVMQSYGAMNEYRRAIFSIWSFYLWTKASADVVPCLIFTDNPDVFEKYCGGLPLKYVLLTAERIGEMRGDIDFVHRVKVEVIKEAFALTEGNILYVDSDTFFIDSPANYINRLSDTQSFMHKYEYKFGEMKNFNSPGLLSFRQLYDFIKSHTFTLSNNRRITIPLDQVSWNAGVIILHKSQEAHLPDVLMLTDALHRGVPHHGCEQYAFCVVLDMNGKVSDCEDLVYHYWLPVKKPIADIFLSERITDAWSQLSMADKLIDMKRWTSVFPRYFQRHVLMIQDQAIQAFNENRFRAGYFFSLRALLKSPLNRKFLLHVMYHSKRLINGTAD
jgi:hypothetical protein